MSKDFRDELGLIVTWMSTDCHVTHARLKQSGYLMLVVCGVHTSLIMASRFSI